MRPCPTSLCELFRSPDAKREQPLKHLGRDLKLALTNQVQLSSFAQALKTIKLIRIMQSGYSPKTKVFLNSIYTYLRMR